MTFFWFHTEIKRINQMIRPLLPDPTVRFDLDSLVWREKVRETLNRFILLLPLPDARGLDVGCGKGHITALFQKLGYAMTGVDLPVTIDEAMGFRAPLWQKPVWRELNKHYGATFRIADATKLPYRDGYFDFIIANAIIEHIRPTTQVPKFLKELHRVLKPAGLLLIAETPQPQSYSEWLSGKLGYGEHEMKLSDETVASELAKAGFMVMYQDQYDLVPTQLPLPGRLGHWSVNLLFPILELAEHLLRLTPLRYFAHHTRTIAKKIKRQ